jgi:hypothetical protein
MILQYSNVKYLNIPKIIILINALFNEKMEMSMLGDSLCII